VAERNDRPGRGAGSSPPRPAAVGGHLPAPLDPAAAPDGFRAAVEDFRDSTQEWRRLFAEFLGTFLLVLGRVPRMLVGGFA
jgi:hypothetical protein